MSFQLKIENTGTHVSFEFDDYLNVIISKIKEEIKDKNLSNIVLFLNTNGSLISVLKLDSDYGNIRMNSSQQHHHNKMSISGAAYNNVRSVLFCPEEQNKLLLKITLNHNEMLYNHILFIKTKDELYKSRINDFRSLTATKIEKLRNFSLGYSSSNSTGLTVGDLRVDLTRSSITYVSPHLPSSPKNTKIGNEVTVSKFNPFGRSQKKIEIQSYDPFSPPAK